MFRIATDPLMRTIGMYGITTEAQRRTPNSRRRAQLICRRKKGASGSGAILIPLAAPRRAPEPAAVRAAIQTDASRRAIIVGSLLQWKPERKMAAGEAKKNATISRLLLIL